jgi:hypothetical protein
VSKPRRKYGSPEAVLSALKQKYRSVWKEYVDDPHPPETLYHYCAHDVLPKILNSGKLWASDVLCMNDKTEITYAFNEIISPLAALREEGNPKYFIRSVKEDLVKQVWGTWCTHVACFSSTPELPSQWQRYAQCAGYAVGFDRSRLDEWCIQQSISLFPMSYDRLRHEQMIRRFLDEEADLEFQRNISHSSPARDALREKAVVYLSSLAMSLKEHSWSDEHEWRILVIQLHGESRFERLTRNGGVCYFELPIVTPQLVTELVFGPRCPAVTAELKQQLDQAGLGSVSIRRCLCNCLGV